MLSTPMPKKGSVSKLVFEIVLVMVAVLLLAAISVPNLLRSRMAANEAAALGRARAALETEKQKASDQRKVITTAEVSVTVKDPEQFLQTVRLFTEVNGGFVSKLEWFHRSESVSGTIVLRLPFDKLESFRAAIRKNADTIRMEVIQKTDVTSEYTDTLAAVRNLQAEEAQYRSIMASAHETKSVLEVAQQLSEVRGKIDKLQGESLNIDRQVDYVAVSVQVEAVQAMGLASIQWRPVQAFREAGIEVASGFTDYTEAVIAFAVHLPLWGLWVLTVLSGLSLAWRIAAWMWFKVLKRILTIKDTQPVQV
jgi:hypothetical protein